MTQNKSPDLSKYYVNTNFNTSADFLLLYINANVKTDGQKAGHLFQFVKKNPSSLLDVYYFSVPPADSTYITLYGTKTKISLLSDLVSTNLKQYCSYLVKLFPCVNPSVFNDDTSILNFMQNTDFIKSFQPPQPCKDDNSVYCCPNVTGPKFFNTKTVIMMLLILGLVVAMGVMLVERNKK